jgi:hypothetical protein
MRDPSPDRPSPACLTCRSRDPAAVLAELLLAHDQAAARGAPLLTNAGVAHVRRLLVAWAYGPVVPGRPAPLAGQPHWDAEDRRLWLGGRLLKTYRQPAQRQVTILGAFEEGGWASGHIDDPLAPEPGEGEEEARWRLHRTIQNMNRGLPEGTIRFHGDGTGEGIRWGFDRPAGDRPSAR